MTTGPLAGARSDRTDPVQPVWIIRINEIIMFKFFFDAHRQRDCFRREAISDQETL
jgi:hypothetical protein